MADPIEGLLARVEVIETKLDRVSEAVDARFDDVTTATVEQRQYTEYAFEKLRSEMRDGFAAMTVNFGRLERKLEQLMDRLPGPHTGS